MQLEFVIEGEKQLSRRLGIVADGIKDFRPPFQLSASEFIRVFKANFSARGSTLGEPWQDRQPQYRAGTRVDVWPLLQETGAMRNSFQAQVKADGLVIFNVAEYFKYHQSNQARKTKLPRRIMMKLDEARRRFIVKSMQEYIVRLRNM